MQSNSSSPLTTGHYICRTILQKIPVSSQKIQKYHLYYNKFLYSTIGAYTIPMLLLYNFGYWCRKKKNLEPSINSLGREKHRYFLFQLYLIIFTSMKMPIEAVIELLKNIIRRVFDEKLV